MTAGQRLRREAWRDVKVNFVVPDDVNIEGQKDKKLAEAVGAEAVVGVLRRSFRDGPAAAAYAHAAYKSWVHGVVEAGGTDPMPPMARRWSEFLDRWNEYDLLPVGWFAEIDGVDFGQVPVAKQKPKMRMRM